LGYFATAVFAPKRTDLEFVRFPPSLGFLYYLVRPVRLACKWIFRLSAHVFQNRLMNVGKQREVAREGEAVKEGQRSDSA
jgi:hypothetical protein